MAPLAETDFASSTTGYSAGRSLVARLYASLCFSASGNSAPLPEKGRPPRGLVIWLIGLTIVKMVLVGHEEILAYYLPHDCLWQVRAARRLYWEGSYQWDTLLHLPVYPFFIEAVRCTGLPLRVATDLLFCLTSSLLAVALWRLRVPTVIAAIAGLAAMYHPASFQLPNICGAEILMPSIIMGAVAASLTWWAKRNARLTLGSAVSLSVWWAMAWNLRSEAVLVAGLLGFLAVCIVAADWRHGAAVLCSRVFTGVLLPVCASMSLATAIKAGNYMRWGLFATTIETAPGYKAAYRELQSIPPKQPLDFIPAPVEVRLRAYSVSPAFSELRPFLEGSLGAGWAGISRPFTDALGMFQLAPQEIAAGWFYWALHDSAVAAGHGNSPAEENRFFQRVADQLRLAQKEGRLSSRPVPIPFLDPSWNRWIRKLPGSLYFSMRIMLEPAVSVRPMQDPRVAASLEKEFDRETNRRSDLLELPEGEIRGWVTELGSRVTSVSLVSREGAMIAMTFPDIPRPDVDRSGLAGFDLRTSVQNPEDWNSCKVVINTQDSGLVDIPMSALKVGQPTPRFAGSQRVTFCADILSSPSRVSNWTWDAQTGWERRYLRVIKIAGWELLLLPLVFAVAALKREPSPGLIATTFLAFAVAQWMTFFALLDATSWQNQPRYLFVVMPLFGVVVVLNAYQVLASALVLFRRGTEVSNPSMNPVVTL